MSCPIICGWRVMRMIPVSHMCSLGSSTAATCKRAESRAGFWATDEGAPRQATPPNPVCVRKCVFCWVGSGGSTGGSFHLQAWPKPIRPKSTRTHLQDVEGGGVEEVEGDEAQRPHQLVHARHAAHVPQRNAVVAVVDEVHHRSHGQGQGGQGKDDAVGARADELLACAERGLVFRVGVGGVQGRARGSGTQRQSGQQPCGMGIGRAGVCSSGETPLIAPLSVQHSAVRRAP